MLEIWCLTPGVSNTFLCAWSYYIISNRNYCSEIINLAVTGHRPFHWAEIWYGSLCHSPIHWHLKWSQKWRIRWKFEFFPPAGQNLVLLLSFWSYLFILVLDMPNILLVLALNGLPKLGLCPDFQWVTGHFGSTEWQNLAGQSHPRWIEYLTTV
jgi:hypothetical protein